eukprot:2772325-Prymnesium_polylepis.3
MGDGVRGTGGSWRSCCTNGREKQCAVERQGQRCEADQTRSEPLMESTAPQSRLHRLDSTTCSGTCILDTPCTPPHYPPHGTPRPEGKRAGVLYRVI